MEIETEDRESDPDTLLWSLQARDHAILVLDARGVVTGWRGIGKGSGMSFRLPTLAAVRERAQRAAGRA